MYFVDLGWWGGLVLGVHPNIVDSCIYTTGVPVGPWLWWPRTNATGVLAELISPLLHCTCHYDPSLIDLFVWRCLVYVLSYPSVKVSCPDDVRQPANFKGHLPKPFLYLF